MPSIAMRRMPQRLSLSELYALSLALMLGSVVLYALATSALATPIYQWIGWARPAARSCPLWLWHLVTIASALVSIRLMDYMQILDKYLAIIAITIASPLYYLLTDSYGILLGAAYILPLLGLVQAQLTYQQEQSPSLHILTGLAIGGLSIAEPWALYLLPLAFIGQMIQRCLSLRHIIAVLMGVAICWFVALPIMAWEAEGTILGQLTDWYGRLTTVSYAFSEGLSIPEQLTYILLLALGLSALSLSGYGAYHESTRQRALAHTVALWIVYLLTLGMLTGGASSLFTLMAIVPIVVALGRTLSHTTGQGYRIALSVIITITLLLFLIP